MNTDNFLVNIKTKNLNKDITKDDGTRLDTSNDKLQRQFRSRKK